MYHERSFQYKGPSQHSFSNHLCRSSLWQKRWNRALGHSVGNWHIKWRKAFESGTKTPTPVLSTHVTMLTITAAVSLLHETDYTAVGSRLRTNNWNNNFSPHRVGERVSSWFAKPRGTNCDETNGQQQPVLRARGGTRTCCGWPDNAENASGVFPCGGRVSTSFGFFTPVLGHL